MKLKSFIFSSLLLLFSHPAFSQRYWVSVTGGNWSNAANWSTTSGGTGGAGAPVSTNAIFDGAGGATGNCTIDIAITVTNFSTLAAYTGSIVQGSNSMSITANSVWSGGTFLGNTANIIHNGSLTISGTNFRSSSATLSLSNTFNFLSGTFLHNNGTVVFHSASLNLNGFADFYNLKFSSSSNIVSINNSLLCASNLTLDASNGSSLDVNLAAATLSINGNIFTEGTGLIRCNTGTIQAMGDITLANTSVYGGGTGTLKIAGSGNQNLSGSTVIKRSRLPNVIIDKPSGTLSLTGIITSIGPNWTYLNGTLAAGTSTVYLQRQAGGSNIVVSGNHTLYDVVFYPEYSISTISNSLTVNNLTLDGSQDHDVDINGAVTVNGTLFLTGASRVYINNGTILAKGDISVSNLNSYGGGTGTISISGAGNQLLSASGALTQGRLPSIVISKPSGTLSILGNITTVGPYWSYISGIVDPGSSTLYLYRNGTNINVSGTHTLNNLFIRNPSYASTIINANLAVNSVTIDGATQHNVAVNSTLTINGNLSITGTDPVLFNSGVVKVKGNITHLNTNTGSGGTATLIINGTSNQSITGTGLANQSKLPTNVVLNKPSGQLIIAGGVPLYFYGSLNFVQGVISTSTNQLLIFAASSSVAGSPGNTSYISGPVRKIGNTAFVFPIGKNSKYGPLGISAPGNATHAFTAEYFDSDPNVNYDVLLKDASLNHVSRCEYWDLQRTSGSSNVSVTVSWDSPRSCGVNSISDLRLAHWDTNLGIPVWKDMGMSNPLGTTTSGSIRSGSVVSSFSPFSLASVSALNPLPVELMYFKATCNQAIILLEWETASEKNNQFFEIEKSNNGLSWDVITKINGKGTTHSRSYYSFSDLYQPYNPVVYFRLKQTDTDGSYTYSNIQSPENCQDEVSWPNIYPNPTRDLFTVEGSNRNEDISIHNSMGKLVLKTISTGLKISIDVSWLPEGMYLITIGSGKMKKIVEISR